MTNRDPYTNSTASSRPTANSPQPHLRDYEEGYRDGQLRSEETETSAISTGFWLALLTFLLVGAGFLSYFFFFNQNRETPNPQTSPTASPVIVPQPQQTTIVQPTRETQVIERTIEKTAPASPTVDVPPQINIQVPPTPANSGVSSESSSEATNSPSARPSPEAAATPSTVPAETP